MKLKGYLRMCYIEFVTVLLTLASLSAAAETLIRCDNETQYALKAGETVRVTTREYPNAILYRQEPCLVTLTSPAGTQIEFTFVNGLLEGDDEVLTFTGIIGEAGNTSTQLNTAFSYGDTPVIATYIADSTLTLSLPFFRFTYWFGFEATASVFNKPAKCGASVPVDLANANGPIEFGTTADGSASLDCSWVVTAAAGSSIKIVVKYALLPTQGEQLSFKGSKSANAVIYDPATRVYSFPWETQLTVSYHRTDSTSNFHGVYIQGSSYVDYTGSPRCDYPTAGSLTVLGKEKSFVAIDNYVQNDTVDDRIRIPYFKNQKCLWQYQIQKGYEFHLVVTPTMATETCCDLLTVTSTSSQLPKSLTLDVFSDQHFAFDRNTEQMVNISWSSDGSVELKGFSLALTARDCVCQKQEVHLSVDNPVETIYSSSDVEYCNNIACQHKIYAPANRSFVFDFSLTIRNITADAFTITDGTNQLFRAAGGGSSQLQYETMVISSSGYMEITLTAGEVWRYSYDDPVGSWIGTVTLVADAAVTTSLTVDSPSAYKSTNEIVSWTIVAPSGHIEVRALSGPTNGINWFTIYDGTDNTADELGDFSSCQNASDPLTSTGLAVTIERTSNFDMATDFIVYVRYTTAAHKMCTIGPGVIQLVAYQTSIHVEAPSTEGCFCILDDAAGTMSGDHFIRLTEISFIAPYDAIQILGGTERFSTVDSVLVTSLDSTMSGVKWDMLEAHNRVVALVLPRSSHIYATATRPSTDMNKPRVVWCGESGTIASREYGSPNFFLKTEMHDEIKLSEGRSTIYILVTTLLAAVPDNPLCGQGGLLRISSSEWGGYDSTFANVTSFRWNVSFTATGFKVDYTPSATGECGFLITYTFEECLYATTTMAPPVPYDFEDLVRCVDLTSPAVTFETEETTELNPIRLYSHDYPSAVGTHHSPCRVEFSAPGKKMKISFVNAFLAQGQEITLMGVGANTTDGSLKTTVNTGVPYFNDYTYFANDNFTVVQGEFDFQSWWGFEAIVTIINDERNCYNFYVIPLDNFQGPYEFGTNWNNASDWKEPHVCSWHLKVHSGTGYAIKLHVLRAQLRPGELLYFAADVGFPNVTYTPDKPSYVFDYQNNVYIYYVRTGPDSDSFGVYFQASNAYMKYAPSSDQCQNATNGVLKLGSSLQNYTLTNSVLYENHTISSYLDNQICEWAFEAEEGYEFRVYIRQIIIEECCDFLILSGNGTTLSLTSTSNRTIVWDQAKGNTLNVSWSSDSSVALAGFVIDVTVFTNNSTPAMSTTVPNTIPSTVVQSTAGSTVGTTENSNKGGGASEQCHLSFGAAVLETLLVALLASGYF